MAVHSKSPERSQEIGKLTFETVDDVLSHLATVTPDQTYHTKTIEQLLRDYGVVIIKNSKLHRAWNKYTNQQRSIERKERKNKKRINGNSIAANKPKQEKGSGSLNGQNRQSSKTPETLHKSPFSQEINPGSQQFDARTCKMATFCGENYPADFIFTKSFGPNELPEEGKIIGYIRNRSEIVLMWWQNAVVSLLKERIEYLETDFKPEP